VAAGSDTVQGVKHLEQGVDTILLPVDFSQPSNRSFDAAVRMARIYHAHLHLLHVNEEDAIFGSHSSEELAHFMDDIARRRGEWMQAFEVRAHGLGVKASSLMRYGDPATTILDTADELDAGLVVMGTQGARGLGSLFPGSVAKKVLRSSERPVMVVSRHAGVEPADSGGTFAHVIYPTDFSPASRDGLAVARELVDRTGARLTLAHVVRLPRVIPSLPGTPPIIVPDRAVAQLRERISEQMAELVTTVGGQAIDSQVTVAADPAEGIAELASQSGVDLVIVPRHSSHGVGSFFFGRTAEHLTKIAPVPVLLFTPRAK
jgi:nucleotide-binding universal stress UspA family protein